MSTLFGRFRLLASQVFVTRALGAPIRSFAICHRCAARHDRHLGGPTSNNRTSTGYSDTGRKATAIARTVRLIQQSDARSRGFRPKCLSIQGTQSYGTAGHSGRFRQHRTHFDADAKKHEREQIKKRRATLVDLRRSLLARQLDGSKLQEAWDRLKPWCKAIGDIEDGPQTLAQTEWALMGQWLYQHETVADMRQAWEALSPEDRNDRWDSVMLSTLINAPEKAARVLQATYTPTTPDYAAADVMFLVASNIARPDRVKRGLELEESLKRDPIVVADEAVALLELLLSHRVWLQQRTLGLLASTVPPIHTKRILDLAQENGHRLHDNTLLQLASGLARVREHKPLALELLEQVLDRGTIAGSQYKICSVVTRLLDHPRQDPREGGWARPDEDAAFTKRALQVLIEKGLQPNIINLTPLIQTLCWNGSFDEAKAMADLFVESGVVLDRRAASALLAGAKYGGGTETMTRALDIASRSHISEVDTLTHLLHAVYTCAERDWQDERDKPNRVESFLPIFELYQRKFSVEPLRRWLPEWPSDTSDSMGQASYECWARRDAMLRVAQGAFADEDVFSRRLEPAPQTIALLLRAYVRNFTKEEDLVRFYIHFKGQLEGPQEDDTASQLMETQGSLIHDCIIRTMLGSSMRLWREALLVFGDMLRDNSGAASLPSDDGAKLGAAVLHPHPRIFTFSVLTRGLLFLGKFELVEQLYAVMQEHGIQHNLVSLNTAIKGYASNQKVEETVAALQHIDYCGFQTDGFTHSSFDRLRFRDKEKAFEQMEAIMTNNSQRLAHGSRRLTERPQVYGDGAREADRTSP